MEKVYRYSMSGDIIERVGYPFNDNPVILIIPHKRMPHVRKLRMQLWAFFIILTILWISLFGLSGALDLEFLNACGYVTMFLSIVSAVMTTEYISIVKWGSKTYKLYPEKFSMSRTTWTNKPIWKDADVEKILDILDTETLRDDFLQLAESAKNNNIASGKIRKVCSHMINIASLDKKIEEEKVDYMLEKYKHQSRFVDEMS